uniref:Uncharacterized protein n=1 Tax=Cuerna arida TaxID=1464854 RepID=A0A1B6FT80_9HEMI
MPQGKLRTKAKLPANVAKKKAKATKGPTVSRKSKPIAPKKVKSQEIQKIKKAISKNVNDAIESEIRARASNTPKVAATAKSPRVTVTKKKVKKASPKKKAK